MEDKTLKTSTNTNSRCLRGNGKVIGWGNRNSN